MDKFEVGDVVLINADHAGMKKGELGIIAGKLIEHGMYSVYFNPKYSYSDGHYNILPEFLDRYTL